MPSVKKGKRWALVLAFAVLALLACSLFPTESAHAITYTPLLGEKLETYNTETAAQINLEKAADIINNITVVGLTADFENLLGESFSTVSNIFGTVAQGLGYVVLVLVYLVQLIKIATHMDGNQTLPGVKDVIFLLIFFVIFKHFVDCSLQYLEEVFNLFNQLTIQVGSSSNISSNAAAQHFNAPIVSAEQMQSLIDADDQTFGSWIQSIVILVTAYALEGAAFFSVLARSLQAYVLAIFAPLPVAFLAMEETRQWGIGYLKNFLAICMAGTIIMIILVFVPYILEAALTSYHPFIALLASCLVCIIAMFRSGSWSRDILGG